MRKLLLVVTLSVVVGAFGFSPAAGAATKSPVELSGTVNVHGKANVSKESKGQVSIQLDDFYFSPTFIKATPGQKITIELENEGGNPHTFTSDDLGVDKELQPGKSAKVKITIPDDATAVQFYCQFHDSQGMQGALYVTKGATASGEKTSSPGGVDYGY